VISTALPVTDWVMVMSSFPFLAGAILATMTQKASIA